MREASTPVLERAAMRGTVHPDFEPVRRALSLCVPFRGPGGAAVSVYYRGEKVVDLAAGTADAAGRPFETDTLAVSMSTTKGVTATAMHVLIDRGLVDRDAPVAKYWPGFARAGKGGITIRQALSHQAGLHEVTPLIDRFEQLYDWDYMVGALERAVPAYEPGSDFGYHGFTFGWLIGEVVRRVVGTPTFSQALEELLARPLGLDGLFIGVPDSAMSRVADVVGLRAVPRFPGSLGRYFVAALDTGARLADMNVEFEEAARALFPTGIHDLDLNDRTFRRASLPAMNGHFDAHSLARLYAGLSLDGSLDGVRLVGPSEIDRMWSEHNGFLSLCRVVPFPIRLGLGYHRIISLGLRIPAEEPFDIGVASPKAFGHFGIGGSGAWADPERELSVGLVTNTFFGKLPMDLRAVAIATAAAYSVDRLRRR